MDMSIIILTIARVTTGAFPLAVSARQTTELSFTARQCMTHAATRHRADGDKSESIASWNLTVMVIRRTKIRTFGKTCTARRPRDSAT